MDKKLTSQESEAAAKGAGTEKTKLEALEKQLAVAKTAESGLRAELNELMTVSSNVIQV